MIPLTPYRRFAVLFAFALIAYGPTLPIGFLMDDHMLIEQIPTDAPLSLPTVHRYFTTSLFGESGAPYYRPLQAVSHHLDRVLWKERVWIMRLENIFLHALNAFLIAGLMLQVGVIPSAAFLAGSLFVVHPLISSEIAMISGRAELLGLLFTLLILRWAWQPGRLSLGLAAAAYVLGLLSKENVIIAPLLVALLFFWKGRRDYGRILAFVPLFVGYLLLRTTLVPLSEMGSGLSPGLLMLFFMKAFPRMVLSYAGQIVLPWDLHSLHMMPRLSPLWPLYGAVFMGLGAFLARSRERLFFGSWFVLMLLPKVPVMMSWSFRFDHWGYPAIPALVWPLGIWIGERQASGDLRRRLASPALIAMLVVWIGIAHFQAAMRKNDEAVMRWTLRFEDVTSAHYHLGYWLWHRRNPEEALQHLRIAAERYPENTDYGRVLIYALWDAGQKEEAIAEAHRLARRIPQVPAAHRLLEMLKKHRKDAPSAKSTK